MGERSANAQEMPQKSTLSLQITQSEGQRTSLFSFSFAAVSNVFRPNSRRSRTGLSRKRVFVEDPPWLFSFTSTDNLGESDAKLGFKELERKKYNALRRRQVKMETEAWEKRAEEYRELVREMCENNLAPNLPYVKFLFLGWFEPLIEAIDKEQRLQELKRQKASYAPYIGLLPADKGSVRVVQAAVYVGDAIEQEARHMVIPHMPMLVPPRNWKGYGKGGHLFLPSYVMRTHGARQQQDAIRKVPKKQMQKVF